MESIDIDMNGLKYQDKQRFTKEPHCHEMLIEEKWQEVPGCSSISGMFDEGLWRCAWASKMAVDYIVENMTPAKAFYDEPQFWKDAKNAWRTKRDTARDSGTILHESMETYIKQKIEGVDIGVPLLIPTEFEKKVEDFIAWEKENKVQWLASELQVGHLEHQYCGILDCLYLSGGNVYLDDIKTSKAFKREWIMQLVGLAKALKFMGHRVDKIGIIHMPKDGGKFQRIPVEVDIDREFEGFLVAKDFYKARNLFNARNK